MTSPGGRGLVADAGALIAIERADPRATALLERVVGLRGSILVPAGALAQVWRGSPRQARLARLLKAPEVAVEPLDESGAKLAGVLCRRSQSSDVVDASVALCARRHRLPVVTSDPDDLLRIDRTLRVVAI